uniref:hypothetical protein n=1 Tax=Streptomyces tubercidicus TaxID=47759 RepID=UPI0030E5C0C0|nr:hypothetical protein OG690_37810 [Streptomyces tubercidicus]
MADITFKQLQAAVTTLTRDVTRDADTIRATAQKIDEEARDVLRVAEMIASMGVDSATTGETRDLAHLTAGVSAAAIDYAVAGDNTAKAAIAAHQQAQATHGGIQEAVSRSTVDVRNLNREWLRQE